MTQVLKWKKLVPEAVIPAYQTKMAAGFDLHAVVKQDIDKSWNCCQPTDNGSEFIIKIPPKSQVPVRTGLAVVIPEGFEMQIRPRSGLAFKKAITITNSPATVDADYRGEVMIILHNLGDEPFEVRHGDRVAQGVLCATNQADMVEIEDFSAEDMSNDRGGGFGSTGK